jgi:WhiB family redox-sensing transcriptional regulator
MSNEWWDESLCLEEKIPTDLFYGTEDETVGERNLRIEMAKAVCSRCSVRTNCLEWARSNDERGIWGGTTENERWRVESAAPTISSVETSPTPRSIWLQIANSDGVVLRMTKRFGDPTWQVMVDDTVRSEHYVEGEGWIAWNKAVEARMRI